MLSNHVFLVADDVERLLVFICHAYMFFGKVLNSHINFSNVFVTYLDFFR